MCLAIPMQIISITGHHPACCEAKAVRRNVSLILLGDQDVTGDDHVLVHVGYAITVGPSQRPKPVAQQQRSASRPDHRSRAKRWNDAVAELVTLQAEYAAWLQSLPDRLQDTATAEVLRTICERDLGALQAVIPPRGFGRDQTFIGGTACTRGPWRLKGSQALGLCPLQPGYLKPSDDRILVVLRNRRGRR